jgi:hypothetical protein
MAYDSSARHRVGRTRPSSRAGDAAAAPEDERAKNRRDDLVIR